MMSTLSCTPAKKFTVSFVEERRLWLAWHESHLYETVINFPHIVGKIYLLISKKLNLEGVLVPDILGCLWPRNIVSRICFEVHPVNVDH